MTNIDNPPNVLYIGQAFRITETPVFSDWLGNLRDRRGAARIANRLLRASDGHLGDVKSVGDGVFEMRIDVGPGYRIYAAATRIRSTATFRVQKTSKLA